MKLKNPKTPAEWQFCVDAAEFYLAMDSAKQYGLITGGPIIDIERCDELLSRGKTLGYKARPLDVLCKEFLGDKTA